MSQRFKRLMERWQRHARLGELPVEGRRIAVPIQSRQDVRRVRSVIGDDEHWAYEHAIDHRWWHERGVSPGLGRRGKPRLGPKKRLPYQFGMLANDAEAASMIFLKLCAAGLQPEVS